MITLTQEDLLVLLQAVLLLMFCTAVLAVLFVTHVEGFCYWIARQIRYRWPAGRLWMKRKAFEARKRYRARVAAAGGVPRGD